MVISIIFLFTNIFIIAICMAVYGGKRSYKDGMLFGVHIPDYAVRESEVESLVEEYSKKTKWFYSINGIASVAVCFLSFWYFSVFLIVWTLWLTELCVGVMWLLFGTHRRLYDMKVQKGWRADIQLVFRDDDVYWKNGWYSNPNDKRLWVPDRFCSLNYSTNMARPAGKIFTFGILGGVAVMMLVLFIVFLRADFMPRDLELNGDSVRISSPMTPVTFKLRDIKDLQLLDEMPEGNFTRTNGLADDRQLVGKFREKATGDYRVYVYRGYSPILKIELPEYTVLINSMEEGQTELWYRELISDITALETVEYWNRQNMSMGYSIQNAIRFSLAK